MSAAGKTHGARARLAASVRELAEENVPALLRFTSELEKRQPGEPLAFVIVPDRDAATMKTAATRLRSVTDRRPVGAVSARERRLLADIFGAPNSELTELATRNKERILVRRSALLSDTLSTDEVREALRLGTRQAIAARVRRNELLAIRQGRELRFPKWQFEDSQPSGVLPGLSDVLRAAAHLSDLEIASWLSREQQIFDGKAPIDVLRAGGADRVVSAVRGIGVT